MIHVPQLLMPVPRRPELHNQETPLQREACTLQLESSSLSETRKPSCSSEDPAESKNKRVDTGWCTNNPQGLWEETQSSARFRKRLGDTEAEEK